MKIIHVRGDGDYAAMFIETEYGVQKAYEDAVANGGQIEIEEDFNHAEVTVMEFGAVDPKFISYLTDKVLDYDITKHNGFFVIENESEASE